MRGDGIHPYERRQLEAAILASQQVAQVAPSAPSTIYPTLHGTLDNSSSAPAHSKSASAVHRSSSGERIAALSSSSSMSVPPPLPHHHQHANAYLSALRQPLQLPPAVQHSSNSFIFASETPRLIVSAIETSESIGSFSSASRVASLQQQQQSKPFSFSDIQSFSDERATIEVEMSVQQQQETDLDMLVGDSDGESRGALRSLSVSYAAGAEVRHAVANKDLSGRSLSEPQPARPADSCTILESTSSRPHPPDQSAATSRSNLSSNSTDIVVSAATSATKRPRANPSTFAGIELPAAAPKGKDRKITSSLGKNRDSSSNLSGNFKSTEFVQSSDDDSVDRSCLTAPAKKARRSSTATTTTTSKTRESGAANEDGRESPLTDYDEPMSLVPANRPSSTKPRRTPSVLPSVLDRDPLDLLSCPANPPAQPLHSDEPTPCIFGVALPALPSPHARCHSPSVASNSDAIKKPKRVVEAVSEDGKLEEDLLAEIDAMNEYMEDQDSDFGGGGKKHKGKSKGKKEKSKRPPRRRPSTSEKAGTAEKQMHPEPDEGVMGKKEELKMKRGQAEKKKDGQEQAEENVPVVGNAVDELAPQLDHDDEEDDELLLLPTSGPSKKKDGKKQAAPIVHESEDEGPGEHSTRAEIDGDVGRGVRRSPRANKGVAKVWDDEEEGGGGGGGSTKKAAVDPPAAKGKGRKKLVAPSSEAEQDPQLDEGEPDTPAHRQTKAKDRAKEPVSPEPTSISPALSRDASSRSNEAKRRMDLVLQAAVETDDSFWPSPDKPNAKGKAKEKEREKDGGDADDEDEEEKRDAEPTTSESGRQSDHTKASSSVYLPFDVPFTGAVLSSAQENDGGKSKPVTPAAAARPRERSTTPFSKTPKPGSLAAILQKRGLATFRAPGLSSRTKIPPLHVNLRPPPPAKKTLATDKPKTKKKKGDESYSDEDKPWYEKKDPEEWDDDDHARWARRMRRIDRGLPADSDCDD
ncbi:hypothetical protein JCM21900_002000 [Sporobolomyces salmonicolor]